MPPYTMPTGLITLTTQSCHMRNMDTLCVPFLIVSTKHYEQQAHSNHGHKFLKPLCSLALPTDIGDTGSSPFFTTRAPPRCSLRYMPTCRVVCRDVCVTHMFARLTRGTKHRASQTFPPASYLCCTHSAWCRLHMAITFSPAQLR